jgi:4-amino-4-deoxy-L-arabinose transferase-like glycosyltransferase
VLDLPASLGAGLGLLTAAFYFLGAGRALDYDGSLTTGLFVKHGSLIDVFRSAYAFNNQPYFSFVEHIVADLGGRTELWLRVVPIVAGAAVVALVATWGARQFGLVAGAIAGAFVAANPMFATLARSVRGYSLMVLGCTAATLIFIDARQRPRSMSRARSVCYVVGLGVAIGTQFYAVLVLAAHIAMLVRDRRLDAAWCRRVGMTIALGAVPYLGMTDQLFSTARERKGTFLAHFPLDAGREVLGHELVAVVVFGALVVLALTTVEWRRGPAPAIATITVALLAIWVVMRPLDLYPRFLVWLVPAVALAVAFAVAHRPRLSLLIAIAVALTAMVLPQIGSWTTDPIASREIARIVERTRAHGLTPCAAGANGEVLAGYTSAVRSVTTVAGVAGCDLLFGMPETSAAILRRLACRFEAYAVLPGTVTIVVMTHPAARPVAAC